jgi:hypothetical protein
MSSREEYLAKHLFEKAEWFEEKEVLHIGTTTGKPCHWTAHPLCGKRLRKWVGFDDLKYAKSNFFCDRCLLLFAITQLANKLQVQFIVKEGKI